VRSASTSGDRAEPAPAFTAAKTEGRIADRGTMTLSARRSARWRE
jgi:hypothetical protein